MFTEYNFCTASINIVCCIVSYLSFNNLKPLKSLCDASNFLKIPESLRNEIKYGILETKREKKF